MSSLSRIPWSVFLPAEADRPVLLLGQAAPDVVAQLGELKSTPSESDGPFGAIVRLPGGPPPDPNELERLSRTLVPGGHWIWISERDDARAGAGAADGPLPGFVGAVRALWSPDASWTSVLSGAGKVELVRRISGRVLAPLLAHPSRRFRFRVDLWAPSGSSAAGGWLLELIADLSRRGVAALDATDLGRLDRTGTGVVVCQLIDRSERKLALKIASDPLAEDGLLSEESFVRALRAHEALSAPTRCALPDVLEAGRFAGHAYRLEGWLPGRPSSELMYRIDARERAVDAAIRWITRLHAETLGPPLAARERAEWARSVLTRISSRSGEADEAFAGKVAAYLERRLGECNIPTVTRHGDYWLGNVLRDVESGEVVGVVDWQHGRGAAAPLDDVLHLLFTRKWLFSGYDQGAFVAAFVGRRGGDRDGRRVNGYLKALGLSRETVGVLTLLYWVSYLDDWEATQSRKSGWYRRSYTRVRGALDSLESRLDGLASWLAG